VCNTTVVPKRNVPVVTAANSMKRSVEEEASLQPVLEYERPTIEDSREPFSPYGSYIASGSGFLCTWLLHDIPGVVLKALPESQLNEEGIREAVDPTLVSVLRQLSSSDTE
jgi:hypothetical protein